MIDNIAAQMKAAAEAAARRAAEEAAKRAAAQAAAERAAAAEAAKAAAQGVANSEGRQAMQDQAAQAAREGDTNVARMMKNEMQMADFGDMPWDAEDRQAMPPAAKRLEEGVSLDDLKADPQLAKDIGALQKSDDPKVRALVEGSAKVWVQQGLEDAIAGGGGKKAEDVFNGYKADLQAVAGQSGLGDLLSKNADMAVQDAAVKLLESKPSMQDLKDNPAKAQLLATLQTNETYKDDVTKLVQGYAEEALSKNLEGKERKDGAMEAVDDTSKEMVAFAEATGLVQATKDGTHAAFEAKKDDIKDTAEKGKRIWEKVGDFLGDVFGKVGDVLGEGLDKLGDVADKGLDIAGDLAESTANLTAEGLDLVGADGAADATRAAGDVANAGLDKAGDIANTVADTAGAAIADGPAGVANLAMEAALGPEKPEYKGELDGVTGAITNRLGKGDSVYMGVSGGAKVGVGVYGEMGVGAQAQLSRNDDGTISLTLEGEVSGAVGVSAKTGASGGAEVGDMKAEGGASADASAEVNAKATARVTMKFDPKNPADAARLKALIEPDAATIAAAATNPMALAAVKGPALAEAMKHNQSSITIAGQVGAKAEASATAGPAEIGAEAGVTVGTSHKMNRDGSTATTVYMNAGASASLGVSAGPATLEAGAGVKANLGMTIERDANGKVTGVSTERAVNASANAGAGVSLGQDAEGKGAAGTTSEVTESLTPAGVEAFNKALAEGKNPISAYAEARKAPGNTIETKSTTTTNEFSIGAKGEVAVAGVQVGLSGQVTFGKSHTDSEQIDGPSIVDNEMNQGISDLDF